MTELEKYKHHILEYYKQTKLENLIEFVDYANPWDIWGCVCDGTKDLNLAFEVKKQLFLELIEYYMEKGLLRFNNYYSKAIEESKRTIHPDYPEDSILKYRWDYKKIKWSKSDDEYPKSKEVIEYLASVFPSEEDFEEYQYLFFYEKCPAAYWFWKDPEDPNDKGQWYACD